MWKIPHLWKKIRSCTRKMSLSCNYLTLMYENDVLSVLMCLAIRFLGVNYLEGQEWVTSWRDACFVKGEKIVWWKSALRLANLPYFHGGWFGVLSKSIALQGIWHRNWCCYCSGVKPGEIGPRAREPNLQKATHFTLENSIRHVGTSASMAAMAYFTWRPDLSWLGPGLLPWGWIKSSSGSKPLVEQNGYGFAFPVVLTAQRPKKITRLLESFIFGGQWYKETWAPLMI